MDRAAGRLSEHVSRVFQAQGVGHDHKPSRDLCCDTWWKTGVLSWQLLGTWVTAGNIQHQLCVSTWATPHRKRSKVNSLESLGVIDCGEGLRTFTRDTTTIYTEVTWQHCNIILMCFYFMNWRLRAHVLLQSCDVSFSTILSSTHHHNLEVYLKVYANISHLFLRPLPLLCRQYCCRWIQPLHHSSIHL